VCQTSSTNRISTLAFGILLLVPPLYLASFIGSFASPLPVNEQWSVAPFLLGLKEGHFSLERLFAFHNEHLIVIPRLCFAALSFVFTWDNRAECWFTFLLTAILFLLIYRGAFPEKESRSFWVAVALLATSLMLFHTNQWQNWLWGFQLAWPLPVLSLVIAVVVIAGSNRRGPRVAGTVAASAMAMLSMGHGLLVPLLIGSIVAYEQVFSRRQRSILEIGVAAVLAFGGSAFFLIHRPPLPQSSENPVGIVRGIVE
jgi:hypothetical protein